METSGLLLVSDFAICKERLNSGTKIRYFSKSRIAYKEKTLEIGTFYVKIHIWQADFEEKYLECPIKKSIFAATNPTTPLNDAYHGGTSLFIKGIWITTNNR